MRTDEDTLAAEELYLLDTIRDLRLQYEAAAKPYVDRLVHLRSIRPHPPVFINAAQAAAAGLVPREQ